MSKIEKSCLIRFDKIHIYGNLPKYVLFKELLVHLLIYEFILYNCRAAMLFVKVLNIKNSLLKRAGKFDEMLQYLLNDGNL